VIPSENWSNSLFAASDIVQTPEMAVEELQKLMREYQMPASPMDWFYGRPQLTVFDQPELDRLAFRVRMRMDFPVVMDRRILIKPELSGPRDWADSLMCRIPDEQIAEVCFIAWKMYVACSLKEIQESAINLADSINIGGE